MMGWAVGAAQVGEELWQGMRVQEWFQRDQFALSCRSRNNLEESDGEEGPAAGLGGCEKPDVAHSQLEGRFVLGVVVVW